MPVINGIKMACDACIRGHRSTKCDHGDSRVLLKVRKPGRPLTACPHLQGKPCDCPKNTPGCGCGSNTVTAAFPKRQGCGDCKTGPKTIVKAEVKTPGPAIPDVPAATAGTFKVKKSTYLAAQLPRARPQSYDGTFFDGIDMNSVNIVGNGQSPQVPSTNGMTMNDMAPPQMLVHIAPTLPNTYTQHVPQMLCYDPNMSNGRTPRNSIANGAGMPLSADNEVAGFSLSNGSMMNGNTNYMPSGSFMASGHMQQPILTSPYTMSSADSYTPSTNGATPATTTKSCCSSKTSLNSSPATFANHSPQVAIQQSYNMAAYNNDTNSLYNNAGMKSMAPNYGGSFAAPQQQIQTGEWSQNTPMNYSQLQFMQESNRSAAPFHLPDPAMSPNMSVACGCGTDCECFGCMSHPQNASTVDYIRNLNSQMSLQPNRRSVSPSTPMQQDSFYSLSNQPQGQMFQPHMLQNFYDGTVVKDSIVTATAMNIETPGSLSRTESPQLSLNGSPFDSMGESQQELDPNDFFFVNYELGGCAGDEMDCQCGDDCQCFGCTIHKPEQERRQREEAMAAQTVAPCAGMKIEDRVVDGSLHLRGGMLDAMPVKKSCCGSTKA